MKNPILSIALLLSLFAFSCSPVEPPEACGPVPDQRQIDWQELEFYAFVHFNINTFTNMEWGLGDESPSVFNPTELDTRQWASICKEAGMKGIIITAKHHDGFCLWPSEYTEHSVKNSPWKDGQGDVIRELADACREYGLKLGIYLSPWDRNHADYGKPEYLDYFRNQLRELLTNYGDVFEVWFDGANGGTGYYGGANEDRRVDKLSYYHWPETYELIRELQPNAVIFSDAGPDVRWVGNESGFAYPTTWSTLMRDSVYGGMPEYSRKWSAGQDTGNYWVPAEVNVSIRPGWYYHPYEDHKVKSVNKLVDIYYEALGRNGTFLLNLPVDKRGLVHEKDAEQLEKMAAKIREDLAQNLALEADATADSRHGNGYDASLLTDGNDDTYWAAAQGSNSATITLDFKEPTYFNRFVAKEYFPLGQRVKAFTLEAMTESGWEQIASETTIGYQRILRLPNTEASSIRLTITDAKCPPLLSEIEVYNAPPMLTPPAIHRDKEAMVTMDVHDEALEIYYTLDGSEPGPDSERYSSPFPLPGPADIRAISYSPDDNSASEEARVSLDIPKTGWKVLSGDENAAKAIDGDPSSRWALPETSSSKDITIDLGETYPLAGFTYLPMQDRYFSGVLDSYAFYTSQNGTSWKMASSGEFSNIRNSPIEQTINFPVQQARFIRLRARSTIDDTPPAYAEIGVITAPQTQ